MIDLTVAHANHYIAFPGIVLQNCIGFDELTQFEEQQYVFLFSRLRRRADVDFPLRMRAASNPGGIGHEWVKARFIDPWRAAQSGVPLGTVAITGKDGKTCAPST